MPGSAISYDLQPFLEKFDIEQSRQAVPCTYEVGPAGSDMQNDQDYKIEWWAVGEREQHLMGADRLHQLPFHHLASADCGRTAHEQL